jgi:hypothetical protein
MARQATTKKPEDDPSANLPANRTQGTEVEVYDFGNDAGAGLQNVTADEMRLPWLTLLQSNSPQVSKPEDQGGVPGARAGMIYNALTGDLYDGKVGLVIVPVVRDQKYIEYVPRDEGGGLVAIYEPDEPLVLRLRAEHGKFGKLPTEDGNEVVQTFSLGVIAVPEGRAPFGAMVGFKSKGIQAYQGLVQRALDCRYQTANGPVCPPLWAHRWRLRAVWEENKKGQYYKWNLTLDGRDDDGKESFPRSLNKRGSELYEQGTALYQAWTGGTVRADYSKMDTTAEAGDPNEVPFD